MASSDITDVTDGRPRYALKPSTLAWLGRCRGWKLDEVCVASPGISNSTHSAAGRRDAAGGTDFEPVRAAGWKLDVASPGISNSAHSAAAGCPLGRGRGRKLELA